VQPIVIDGIRRSEPCRGEIKNRLEVFKAVGQIEVDGVYFLIIFLVSSPVSA
jgi:hypothetical protein